MLDQGMSGRPRVFAAEVKAMACQPPQQQQVPLARWSSAELAAQAFTEGVVNSVLGSTVRRWPAGDAIKPWRFRSWIFPRDKDFAVKPGRVLDPLDRTLCRLAKVLVPVLRVDGLVPGDFEFGNDVVVQKFVEPASHCVALSQPPTQPVVDA